MSNSDWAGLFSKILMQNWDNHYQWIILMIGLSGSVLISYDSSLVDNSGRNYFGRLGMSTLRTNDILGVYNSITIVARCSNITTTNVQQGLAKAWIDAV